MKIDVCAADRNSVSGPMGGSRMKIDSKQEEWHYEEGLDDTTISKSVRAIAEADVLIIGGTSLNVYPAAGFINYYHGNKLVLINKSETPYDHEANLLIHDSIGKVLKACVADL